MPYLEVFAKYFDFSGRAKRTEYWLFHLIHAVVSVVLLILGVTVGWVFFVLLGIYYLASIIPSLAVLVRRLHDTGRSGWWILIGFVPFGGFVLFIFTLMGSDGPNYYGPEPD